MAALKIGFRELIAAAEREIETLAVEEAASRLGDPQTLFVDLRDRRELEREGRIPGAFHCPRGMLEFWIDPDSPYFRPVFAEPRHFLFYCASGWRSALATKTAVTMGLQPASHIGGGFSAWRAAGHPMEDVPPKAERP
jgi:rhodanese-related sulfurtransferase